MWMNTAHLDCTYLLLSGQVKKKIVCLIVSCCELFTSLPARRKSCCDINDLVVPAGHRRTARQCVAFCRRIDRSGSYNSISPLLTWSSQHVLPSEYPPSPPPPFLLCCVVSMYAHAQIAKVFAADPSPTEGGGSAGGGAQRKKSSMATNTLATKFKGSLTTLMCVESLRIYVCLLHSYRVCFRRRR